MDFYLKTYEHVNIDIKESPEVKNQIDQYFMETKCFIEKSVKKENLITEGNFELLGVNIYNARYLDNFIVTEYFLMYKEENNEKILYGDFVVKVNEELNISEVYKLIR